MRLYNTLTRTEEEFTPSEDNLVRMYACGLTVYSRGHIGNFRTFVAVDVLRRTLRHLENYNGAPGHELHRCRRSDDCRLAEGRHAASRVHESVDRRVSRGCPAPSASRMSKSGRGRPIRTISTRWRSWCGRSKPTATRTRATVRSTSRSRRLPQYGRLARLDHDGLKAGARVDSDNYDKDNARDFVLWKATQAPDEPSWDFGFGRGRPGWHLECSAMALRLLGRAADRHPLRRRRSHFPASRKRDRAKRRRDQQAVRALLDARRASADRRREDVEVARQRLQPARHRREGLPAVDAALSAALDALPQAGEVQLGRDGPGGGGAAAAGRLRRAARSRDGGGGASRDRRASVATPRRNSRKRWSRT